MKRIETVLKQSYMGDLTGAFADGAILFPLMAALAVQTGMNGAMLLATAGMAYIAAGFIFRVPMSVQPLKSVVVAALALGASAVEVGYSGLVVGVCCLALSFCKADRLAALVPRHLVHGLQMALGIMLIMKGMKSGLFVSNPYLAALFIFLTAMILLLSVRTDKPVMGWIAAVGILGGVAIAFNGGHELVRPSTHGIIHLKTIFSLALSQVVLTLANSVVGTCDVAQRYFGAAARLVTPTRLLRSIGIGNILVAPLGGLPFCHGAGGVTAHMKGGAKSWHMNLIIGAVLLGLAALSLSMAMPLIPAYPQILMAALLLATGWFHMLLAKVSWGQADLRWLLVAMGLAALITQDMLWVLVIGVAGEGIRHLIWVRRQRI